MRAKKKATPKPTMAIASARLTQCWPVNTTGALENSGILPSPASLPKAITEPENVMAPTNVPMKSSSGCPRESVLDAESAGIVDPAIAISTAARPTSECIAATSSGICVIWTRRATSHPTRPPTAMPPTIMRCAGDRQRRDHRKRHADDAEQLPRRAERGGQPLEREDKKHRRDEVGQGNLTS